MMINVALFGLGRVGIMHAEDISLHSKFNLKLVKSTYIECWVSLIFKKHAINGWTSNN